jgi:hypothetical protein
MRKVVLVITLVVCLAAAGCYKGYGGRHLKHTNEVRLIYHGPATHLMWFMRGNGELFAMNFDNPPDLATGTTFADITYYDDNADMQHFVKARLK